MNAILTKKNNRVSPLLRQDVDNSLFAEVLTENKPGRHTDFEIHNDLESLPGDVLELLTPEARKEIAEGTIPNLLEVCEKLYFTFVNNHYPFSALQFIPVFQQLINFQPSSLDQFLSNPKTNHILVKNSLMKVVLIHWKPGHFSSIHGHPKGGCVFKVLSGSLEEKRYSPDAAQKHLGTSIAHKGCIAYIDDRLAHHAVGNPFDTPAISLHAYTPGLHK